MPVTRPAIVWKGAHPSNIRAGRGGAVPEALTIHTMAGTLAGCDSWFNTFPHIVRINGRDVDVGPASAHFGVGRNGEVHQYVKLEDQAIANGAEAGATAWLVRENPNVNMNAVTISIEHDDLGRAELPTVAQLEASARLAAWLWETAILPSGATNLALDRNHIIRHSEFAPRSRANCPGWPEAMLTSYIERMRQLLAGTPQPVPPPVDYRPALVAELRGIVAAADDDATRAAVRRQDALQKLRKLGETA